MGHASGETADRFHFLGLAQLDLQGAALGNIADDGDYAILSSQFDSVGGHLHGAHFTGLYGDADFQIAKFAGTFQKRNDLLAIFGIGQTPNSSEARPMSSSRVNPVKRRKLSFTSM